MAFFDVPVGERFRFKSRVLPCPGTDALLVALRRSWELLKRDDCAREILLDMKPLQRYAEWVRHVFGDGGGI